MLLAYCTNVHAGADLETTVAELERHAAAVRRLLDPADSLGLGLWFSARTAAELRGDPQQLASFARWLEANRLVPVTFNGFPFGDFHRDVVKHDVYRPPWWDEPRFAYTCDLVELIDALLPPDLAGTISTLPIGWPTDVADRAESLRLSATWLARLADRLSEKERATGRRIVVCLEPEPGCLLQRAGDVVDFFERYLDRVPGTKPSLLRRHLGVCHDTCHSAVMFEPQREAIEQYREAGIAIAKVQLSSALRLPIAATESESTTASAGTAQLREFAEDRYLHQTVHRRASGDMSFFEDLPQALDAASRSAAGEWRTHFHVPIYLESLEALQTTQSDIVEFLSAIEPGEVLQYEVETYAWNVLPTALQRASLAEGIADELRWVRDRFGRFL